VFLKTEDAHGKISIEFFTQKSLNVIREDLRPTKIKTSLKLALGMI
jgi:hypothetical protein